MNTTVPIDGKGSLEIKINTWGNNAWWLTPVSGTANQLVLSGQVKNLNGAPTPTSFCTAVYYAGQSDAVSQCWTTSAVSTGASSFAVQAAVDSTKQITQIGVRVTTAGTAPIDYLFDDATLALYGQSAAQPTPTPAPTATPSPSATPGPSATPSPTATPAPSAYVPVNYTFPAAHPFISLSDFNGAAVGSSAYTRFIAMVTTWESGNHGEYGYTPSDTVIGYKLTGNAAWIQEAITEEDAYVQTQIKEACAGTAPDIAGDDYLYAGDNLQDIALVYDYGFSSLTTSQKALWGAFMNQVVTNIWNFNTAAWGGPTLGCVGATKSIPWSGWATADVGDNYYYRSFMKSTQLSVLALQNTAWVPQLQKTSFPSVVNYYSAKLPDGGSREGTGYGVSQATLFDDYRFWKASLGEDLSKYMGHVKNSIEYWVHATVPTLDQFVPLGDQSRSSQPVLYDYHRNLVHEATLLSKGTVQAQHGTWWLNNISIKQMTNGFNYWGDLFALPDTAVAPTDLYYHAVGAGVVFARTDWTKTATHMSFVAGQQEESHYGQEQGNFSLFKNTWRSVDSNIWSSSGINQDVGGKNGLRFESAPGTVIAQNTYVDTSAPVMNIVSNASGLVMSADLSQAYSSNKTKVSKWTRQVTFQNSTLYVVDTCTVGSGVAPYFQVQVPALPVVQADGSIVAAGVLKIMPITPLAPTVKIEQMSALNSDYSAGHYRVSLGLPVGAACAFEVQLQAL